MSACGGHQQEGLASFLIPCHSTTCVFLLSYLLLASMLHSTTAAFDDMPAPFLCKSLLTFAWPYPDLSCTFLAHHELHLFACLEAPGLLQEELEEAGYQQTRFIHDSLARLHHQWLVQ